MAHHAAAQTAHHHSHEEEHESLKTMGFWMFLITDVILFSVLFATFIILRGNFNGGPGPHELFQMPGVIAETFILLTSSFTCGLAVLSMNAGKIKGLIGWLAVTGILGIAFLTLEITEFVHMVNEGATISTSAFLTAFYTLVGTHGLHVTIGIVWMTGLIIQLKRNGLNVKTKRKVNNISLYWHFLDIIWIFVFSFVYLMGVM
ncbi:cytochrome o ubiquinol oxidase subunit III [Paenibacillus sp. GCM10012307]|uniref:Cytochrome bo(3) ubiquinol oxidase subunit 3 n=1 Tax=Paenibacillus roseus TaxID=2798579 RepID=A0A934MSX9_9BACL|nr:cytochrome o ubiquinol oxidase subunit III [Paenibacillus roseus]MBJ6363699.1 cytochrome o ubiquinol oxidase subunit III [Paenibacillus roseus]